MRMALLTWEVSEALWLAPFTLAVTDVELHLHGWAHRLAVVGRDLHHDAGLQKSREKGCRQATFSFAYFWAINCAERECVGVKVCRLPVLFWWSPPPPGVFCLLLPVTVFPPFRCVMIFTCVSLLALLLIVLTCAHLPFCINSPCLPFSALRCCFFSVALAECSACIYFNVFVCCAFNNESLILVFYHMSRPLGKCCPHECVMCCKMLQNGMARMKMITYSLRLFTQYLCLNLPLRSPIWGKKTFGGGGGEIKQMSTLKQYTWSSNTVDLRAVQSISVLILMLHEQVLLAV